MRKKISATIITGFLGTGKTTMIRNIMKNNIDKRIAIIINEFGDFGTDGEIIGGCGIENCNNGEIIELTNGCLCCKISDDFIPNIQKIIYANNPPDHIIIETSGLALPQPLIEAFRWPEIRSRINMDGTITLLDASLLLEIFIRQTKYEFSNDLKKQIETSHARSIEDLLKEQIISADMLILNKCDLLLKDELDLVKKVVNQKIIKQLPIQIISTRYCSVDNNILLGNYSHNSKKISFLEHEDHNHDEFESFVLHFDHVVHISKLEKLLNNTMLKYDLLRIKGFLNILGKPMRYIVQGVGQRFQNYFDRPWSNTESRSSVLTIIGFSTMKSKEIKSYIINAISMCK